MLRLQVRESPLAPSPTSRYYSCIKGTLRVAFDYSRSIYIFGELNVKWFFLTVRSITIICKHIWLIDIVVHSRGWPEGSLFDSLTTPRCREEGATPFPWIAPLYPWSVPIYCWVLIAKGGIKYHFLSLWYDSTWDWTQVSRAIGEHSNR